MKYRKRNPDGSFGELVETPGNIEKLSPEMQILFEALVYKDMEVAELTERLSTLEAEVQALKGGSV
ncbi:hypothetical protein [Brevibacillus fulvus]|uniref:Polyhydroxyalkanoate synthesis regulator phasin n=1 Tax=Brevibacillus fulvus TaxID=1125967 RepID=A0A938Y2T3_9BACL|nr:hypothetical protein [Brevibacillus fulvus]MBM7592241.1 polyhydroxyalkanoate synthesis regulator phasin [Brevibacillus fulvus]